MPGEWRPYHKSIPAKVTADGALEIKDDPLKQSEILEVTSLSVTGTNHGATEYLFLGYFNRDSRSYVKHGLNTAAVQVVTNWEGLLRLTEGMYPLAYLEAANTGETVVFNINGQKWTPTP